MTGYYDTRSPVFVSRDGEVDLLRRRAEADRGQGAGRKPAPTSPTQLSAQPGVVVGGAAVAQEQVNKQVEKDLRMAEMLAFPLLFLLSLLFFRSLVASLLPLMIGGLAIVGTFLILRIASEFGSISIFALNLTTALGLGLAIDYSLFIVSRYREEIAKDGPGLAAMRRVLATSGRTVFFSSLTVAAALASLLVFPQRFLYSMGLGGVAGGAVRGADLADRAARRTDPARHPGQRALAALPAAPRRGRRAARRERLLVPALALRHAPAGAGGDAQRPAADRRWACPSSGSSSTPSTRPSCPRRPAPARPTTRSASEFPPYRETPIWVDVEGGGPKARRAVRRTRCAGSTGVAEVDPPAARCRATSPRSRPSRPTRSSPTPARRR